MLLVVLLFRDGFDFELMIELFFQIRKEFYKQYPATKGQKHFLPVTSTA